MGLISGGKAIINNCVKKVSKAKEACAELGQSFLSAQEEISGNWHGEAGAAMVFALGEIWDEVNNVHKLLVSAEKEVRAQGNYIINNWTDDSEVGD